jgi:methyl coenzyme M reductase gamma subunit
MQSEDQYLERTPDLVAKVRAMRVAAEKEMNRFTRVADYDVRRVVGHRPKPAPVSAETVAPVRAGERARKRATPSASAQGSIEFAPAPAERADTGEDA